MRAAIRLASKSDAAACQAIYAPIVAETSISFEATVPSIEEMVRRIESTIEHYPWLVCELDGQIAGYAYASSFRARPAYRWTAEISIAVAGAHRRKNIGRALGESLLGVLECQRFHTVVAVIALPNDASIALHEQLGFVNAGVLREVGFKLGGWRDVALMEKQFGPPAELREPLPVKDVIASSRGAEVLEHARQLLRR